MTAVVSDAAPPIAAATDAVSCFHCGLPLPARAYAVVVGGVSRDTCCRGCQAIAGLIAGQGLDAYYRSRTAFAPAVPQAAAGTAFAQFDLPQVQAGYVREIDERSHEAALLIENVTCAACLWLIEQRLLRLAGVTGASVNHGTQRLRVVWDATRVKLSEILAAIAALGYAAHLYDSSRSEALLLRQRRALLWRLFVAAFGMMQVMMYAFPAYVTEGEMPADIERLMQWAGLALTLPVVIWSTDPFLRGAWRALAARTLNRDVPVSIGIVTAFAASVAATISGSGAVYYDSVCMFVFLLLGTRYLELNARAYAAREQDRVARLVPATATRLPRYPDTAAQETLPAAVLQPGDVVLIRPGAAVPGDGVVVDGAGKVSEALLTGESQPQTRNTGERVMAGAINGETPLLVRLTHTGQQTTVAALLRLMDRALQARPRLASLADAIAGQFVLALLIVVALSAAAWWFIDPSRVLGITLSLLVITCPCALSLATPAALVAATGSLSRRGIVLTRGHALETLAQATHFVFDKTGTLTQGRMSVTGVWPLGTHDAATVSAMAAALEASSEHPMGRALAAAPSGAFRAREIRQVTGQGVEGVVDGVRLRAGSPQFVAVLNRLPLPAAVAQARDDETLVALGSEYAWLALFTLGDALRLDAPQVVRSLAQQGREIHLLSGDRVPYVNRIAQQLGIKHVRGEATPAAKLDYVSALQREGAVVAVVGDGINDAPVLAQAQVSVAMACSSELTRLNADVVLLTDRIEPLLAAVTIARRTLRIIRQNFVWAVIYNVIAVPLAVLGYVTPLIAAVGMSASSLLVIANALRLCERAPRVQDM